MDAIDVAAAVAALSHRRTGRHLLLLLDFDGTLVPFDPDPAAVRLPASLQSRLAALTGCARISVGIVSGRRLADLRQRIPIPGLILAGLHGLEIDTATDAFVHAGAAGSAQVAQRIAAALRPRLADLPGVFIENKGLSIVLHYREASPSVAAQAQSIFLEVAREALAAGRLRMLPGSGVIELLPSVAWDKGHAVRWIRERVEAAYGPVFTVYIGDDVTDEDAFRAVGPGGLTIAASDHVRGADVRLEGPAAVGRLLHSLNGSEDNRRA